MRKLLILFPMAMTFAFILAGCGSSSPSSIVIRSIMDPADLEASWNFMSELNRECGEDVACGLTMIETLPPITGNSAPVIGYRGGGAGFIDGIFYATFDTGRAATGAITWTLTVGGTDVPLDPEEQGYNMVFLHVDIPPTGEIVLTASTTVAGVADRQLTLNPVWPSDFGPDYDMREWLPRLPMGNPQRPSNSRRY